MIEARFFVVVSGLLLSLQGLADQSAFDQQMQRVLEPYLAIQQSLAADKTDKVASAAAAIAAEAAKLDVTAVTQEHREHYRQLPQKLVAAADKVARAQDIKAAREAFRELSKPMAMWASMAHPQGISVVYCSMAPGSWLQRGADVRNPYYGAAMLTCGDIVGGEHAKAKSKPAQHH